MLTNDQTSTELVGQLKKFLAYSIWYYSIWDCSLAAIAVFKDKPRMTLTYGNFDFANGVKYFETTAAWDMKVAVYRVNEVWCLAAPVAELLRALFLNRSIISPLCLVWVRSPLWPHVRQAKFCLRVCQVGLLRVLPFSPT